MTHREPLHMLKNGIRVNENCNEAVYCSVLRKE